MAACIYPNCNESVDFESKPTAYCKLGKHLPLFLCPYCKEPNRALAAHCRKCGEGISFVTTRQQFDREFYLQSANLTKEFYSLDLVEYRISQDNLVMPPYPCFGGVLLLTTNGRCLWLDYYHKELIREFNFDLEEIAIPPFHNSRELFVFTTRSIFKVNLVTFEQERIFTTGAIDELILHSKHAFCNGKQSFILLIYNPTTNQTSLKRVSLENGDVQDNDTFRGKASYPVKIDNNRLFFFTPSEIICCDLNQGEIAHQQAHQYDFDVNIPPQFSTPQLYILSNDSIFRINTQGTSYSVMPVTLPSNVSQIKFQLWDANLIVAHSKGLIITSGRGREVFNSEKIYVDTDCTKFAPVVFGKQIAFSALFRSGEVLYLLAENSYRVITQRRYENILFQPVIALGHLFLMVKEQGAIILKVYIL